MQLDYNLQLLLKKELPRMTLSGSIKFRQLMEEAILGVVKQAIPQSELDSYHVTKMTQ